MQVIYVSKGKQVGHSGKAFVELLPSGLVVKTPIPNPYCPPEERDHRQNMRIEAQVYDKLGQHPRIPRLVNWDPESCCLTLEYLENGNLRDYIGENSTTITPQLRLQWARQAAEGLAVLHAANVLHCDLSQRNLLDSNFNLKISDFGGSSINGLEPTATPSTRFKHPGYDWDALPVVGDDIFSLGSLIYFIMTNSSPYEEIPSDEVDRLYEAQQFADVSNLSCGHIIMQCWLRQVDTAQAVYDRLAELENE
jgi:serine/threonine protein kinase